MLILKFRKYNNSLYKLSSDFQIVTVLGLQFIIFILQQLHNLITTALMICFVKLMIEQSSRAGAEAELQYNNTEKFILL